jgi:hypothetical protein
MYESIKTNNELENEVSSDLSYFWYSDVVCSILTYFRNKSKRKKRIYNTAARSSMHPWM